MVETTDILTSGAVIFFSAGLLSYWCSRTLMFLRTTEEELDEVLEDDLWWGRKALYTLRMLLFPPSNLSF
jgi:hypothetical protein